MKGLYEIPRNPYLGRHPAWHPQSFGAKLEYACRIQ